jgi:phosphoglycerol transferase MdoB-like AlkP superfamily enzyme
MIFEVSTDCTIIEFIVSFLTGKTGFTGTIDEMYFGTSTVRVIVSPFTYFTVSFVFVVNLPAKNDAAQAIRMSNILYLSCMSLSNFYFVSI